MTASRNSAVAGRRGNLIDVRQQGFRKIAKVLDGIAQGLASIVAFGGRFGLGEIVTDVGHNAGHELHRIGGLPRDMGKHDHLDIFDGHHPAAYFKFERFFHFQPAFRLKLAAEDSISVRPRIERAEAMGSREAADVTAARLPAPAAGALPGAGGLFVPRLIAGIEGRP